MTIYNINNKTVRPPDSPIEVGITICTREHIVIDMGGDEYALVPAQDKRVHLKCLFKEYTDKFVVDYVAKRYGKSWVVMSHNLCIEDDLHPF
jgi:hypothetical protein